MMKIKKSEKFYTA